MSNENRSLYLYTYIYSLKIVKSGGVGFLFHLTELMFIMNQWNLPVKCVEGITESKLKMGWE